MKEARYFYVPNAATAGELPSDEASHACRVLRLVPGDEVWLIDGSGTFRRAEITLITSKQCRYRIAESVVQQPTWTGRIHLAIAPTKMSERIEWLAEKATEIGFDALTPLLCRFSERRKLNSDRLRRIVVSAVKQSRKAWMPGVSELTAFSDFIKEERAGGKYICHCYDEIPRDDFYEAVTARRGEDITVLVGPEGDFSIDEVREAIAHGYRSVSLGKSRLRTETAGLMAVAMSNIASRI